MTNYLYYGDNLDVLRKHVEDESVDLIYLDPPFKSNADYNVLFAEKDGAPAAAQLVAFEDTWEWNETAALAYHEIVESGGKVSQLMQALMKFLGGSDMMAYLAMMAPRLVELHRVLAPTGSLYLHCDSTASHYLKLLLDSVFGVRHFRREVIWRSGWVSGFKTRVANWIRNHDVILYYTKSDEFTFNIDKTFMPHPPGYRRRGGGENPQGVRIDDVWSDIYSPMIMSFSTEKLGYPTQKPVKLLERIIEASSNEGDVVLDPFCGCGTAIHAAQELDRSWIGINITHLASGLVKHRLQNAFGAGVPYEVVGEPTTVYDAEDLAKDDPYQFQWWAVGLVGGRLDEKKKGADQGIDGRLYFHDDPNPETTKQIILSVKAGKIPPAHIRELRGTVERGGAEIVVLISMREPTKPMRQEAAKAGFYKSPWGTTHPRIQILTIEELLGGKGIDYPRTKANVTFRKARRVMKPAATKQALPFDEEKE